MQYRTAWHMLHRIREACSGGAFTLGNVVEADETYIGGLERNKYESKKLRAGRGTVGKTPVMGAREKGGNVVAKPVDLTDSATLVPFIGSNVIDGATVYTDEASAYWSRWPPSSTSSSMKRSRTAGASVCGRSPHQLDRKRVDHSKTLHSRNVAPRFPEASWPLHERATFRLNQGNCEVDTIERMRAFAKGIHNKRLSYAKLIADNGQSAQPVTVR